MLAQFNHSYIEINNNKYDFDLLSHPRLSFRDIRENGVFASNVKIHAFGEINQYCCLLVQKMKILRITLLSHYQFPLLSWWVKICKIEFHFNSCILIHAFKTGCNTTQIKWNCLLQCFSQPESKSPQQYNFNKKHFHTIYHYYEWQARSYLAVVSWRVPLSAKSDVRGCPPSTKFSYY